jgi:hypothetical protein
MHTKLQCLGIAAVAAATAFAATAAQPRAARATSEVAAPAPPLRLDVRSSDPAVELGVRATQLVVVTDDAVVATRALGRVDGAFRVPGVDGTFLLLRRASGSDGFLDAVFRVHEGRLRRVHVRGPYGDGLVTAYVVTTTIDIDCGAAPGTVVQVEQQPLGPVWQRTLLTFALRNDVLTFTHATTSVVSGAQAGHRRCNVARR